MPSQYSISARPRIETFVLTAIYVWHSLPVSVLSSERLDVLKVCLFEYPFALEREGVLVGSLSIELSLLSVGRVYYSLAVWANFTIIKLLYYFCVLLRICWPMSFGIPNKLWKFVPTATAFRVLIFILSCLYYILFIILLYLFHFILVIKV